MRYGGTDNLEIMSEARNYNRYLASLVRNYSGVSNSILDFGAGTGTFARALRDGGPHIECVEPDALQSQILRSEGFKVYERIEDVENNKFDYIYSLNVLEHIEDDNEMLRVLHSKLRPSGRLFLYVPAFALLFSSMDRKVGHFRRYRRHDLVERLSNAGFEVERARYCDSLGFFASLVFKWFGNSGGRIDRNGLIIYDRLIFPVSRCVDILVSRMFGKNVYVHALRR